MMKNFIASLALVGGMLIATPHVSMAQDTRVDLTYAAEKAVNSVVYIKVTTNAKVQTVPYHDPFEDFFGEFFGHGAPQQRERKIQTN